MATSCFYLCPTRPNSRARIRPPIPDNDSWQLPRFEIDWTGCGM